MTLLQFVASLVNSLVWPLVVVVALVLFRNPVAGLVQGAANGRLLQRLKAGPVEIEWEKLDQAEAQAASPTEGKPNEEVAPDLLSILEFASAAPEAAVVRTSKTVEYELFSAMRRAGLEPEPRFTMLRSIDKAEEAKVIPKDLADTLHILRRIRNQVVHGTEAVTPARGAQYALTAADVIDQLKTLPADR